MTRRLLLAIDTTGEVGSLALAEDGPRGIKILEEVAMHSPDGFAHVMFPEIEALLARHNLAITDIEGFAAAADLVFARRPYEVPAEHMLVRRMQAAAGGAPVCGLSFWADSGVFADAGIPSVLFGPGGAGLHGLEEYVNADDVLRCEEALGNLVRSFCV